MCGRENKSSLFCSGEKSLGDSTVPLGYSSLCPSHSSNLCISVSYSHGQKVWNSGDVVRDQEGVVGVVGDFDNLTLRITPETRDCLIAHNLIFLKSLPSAPTPTSPRGVG